MTADVRPDITGHGMLFETAWTQPGRTAIELPPVDVNEVLTRRSSVDRDLTYTCTVGVGQGGL